MGYGHLRAARPIARALGVDIFNADQSPLATDDEARLWRWLRSSHELSSRGQRIPGVGSLVRGLLDSVTAINPLPQEERSRLNPSVALLEMLAKRGLGQGMIRRLQADDSTLLTTFYAPAIVADRGGCDRVYSMVTDADAHRVWAPRDPGISRINYLAPTPRVARRLAAYGVPRERIHMTGFPLPPELVGGPDLTILKRNLAARLVRLDRAEAFRSNYGDELRHFVGELPEDQQGRSPLLTFAVGGAGAQAELADDFLASLRGDIARGRIRIALIAGIRPEVADRFRQAISRAGVEKFLDQGIEILFEPEMDAYFGKFDELMARTDILWTKPSELTFYGALGMPLVLSSPIGTHERYNRRYLREHGVGLKNRDPRYAASWLDEWLDDGTLAAAAWSGFMRLPKYGTQRVCEILRDAGALPETDSDAGPTLVETGSR